MPNESKLGGDAAGSREGRKRLALQLAGKRFVVVEELLDLEIDGIWDVVRDIQGFDTVAAAIDGVEARMTALKQEILGRYPSARDLQPQAEQRQLSMAGTSGEIRLERTVGFRMGDREHFFSFTTYWDILDLGIEGSRAPVEALLDFYGNSVMLLRFIARLGLNEPAHP